MSGNILIPLPWLWYSVLDRRVPSLSLLSPYRAVMKKTWYSHRYISGTSNYVFCKYIL